MSFLLLSGEVVVTFYIVGVILKIMEEVQNKIIFY